MLPFRAIPLLLLPVVMTAGVRVAAQEPSCTPGPAVATPFAPELADSGRLYRAVFTAAGRELWYFKKVGDDPRAENYRIFRSRRGSNRWTPAERVALGEDASDLYPAFSADGNRLVFASYRRVPGDTSANPNASIWMTRRAGATWAAPVPVESTVMHGFYHSQLAIDHDGNLRFRRSTPDYRTTVTMIARWNGRAYDTPVIDSTIMRWVGWRRGLHVAGGDVSPDGRAVVLDVVPVDSAGRHGRSDLWVSRLDGASWREPFALRSGVNDGGKFDNFAFFSHDGCTLIWTRHFSDFMQVDWSAALAAADAATGG